MTLFYIVRNNYNITIQSYIQNSIQKSIVRSYNFINKIGTKITMKKQQHETQYIDEYRKINTIEKLPAVEIKFMDIFQEKDKDNNKFMRLRKQPKFQFPNKQCEDIILENNFVQKNVKNLLERQKNQYINKDCKLMRDTEAYQVQSKYNRMTNRQGKFKFFYGQAQCPIKISDQSIGKDAYDIKNIMGLADNNQLADNLPTYDDKLTGLKVPNSQYNFTAINKNRHDQYFENQQSKKLEKDQEEALNLIRNLKRYEKYKDLKSIDKMQENKMLFDDFNYSLKEEEQSDEKLTERFIKKFIYKSIIRQNFDAHLDVEYFRDIGLPSWNMQKFTSIYVEQKPNKQWADENLKEQPHLLHLLRQKQLNIQKNKLSFDDISNISTARILSSNAYLCIRSQKITRAQFQKLLKRLDKYKMQERQRGKKKNSGGINTQDVDNIQENSNNETIQISKGLPEHMIYVNQIMNLRAEGEKFRKAEKNADIILNRERFQTENFNRMKKLINKLYNIICVDRFTYPLSNVEQYLDRTDQILRPEFRDGRILWFIIECYEDSTKKIKKEDNIINLLKNNKQEPVSYQYKGSKLIKEAKVGSKNLYTWRQKNKQDDNKNNKNRSRSPLPILDEMSQKNSHRKHTPVKQTAKKTYEKSSLNISYNEKTKKKPFY